MFNSKQILSITISVFYSASNSVLAQGIEGYQFKTDDNLTELIIHCGENSYDHVVITTDSGNWNIATAGGYKSEITERLIDDEIFGITTTEKLNSTQLNEAAIKYEACEGAL